MHDDEHYYLEYFQMQSLSNNRFILGVASGDRPIEYPVFDKDFGNRGKDFREAIDIITGTQDLSKLQANDLQILPKEDTAKLIVLGPTQHRPQSIGQHQHGWLE